MISLTKFIQYSLDPKFNNCTFICKTFENLINIDDICCSLPLEQINEYHSKYDGQVTFCKSLAYSIEEFCKKNNTIPDKIVLTQSKLKEKIKKGLFFKEIIIIKNYDILEGGYKSFKDDFDKNEKY